MVDVDNFRKINEDYGHDAGDMVLKSLVELEQDVTQRLKELESSDIEELTQRAKTLKQGFDRAEEGIKQTFIDFNFDVSSSFINDKVLFIKKGKKNQRIVLKK